MKLLFVCTGNICRSPLAEGIMRKKIDENQLVWTVDSAGMGSWHIGEPPDKRSIQVAHTNNVDISHIRARQFETDDFEFFDWIIPMDLTNRRQLLRMSKPEQQLKIRMMMDFLYPNELVEVPDPYYGDESGFKTVYQMLEQSCNKIIESLEKASHER